MEHPQLLFIINKVAAKKNYTEDNCAMNRHSIHICDELFMKSGTSLVGFERT